MTIRPPRQLRVALVTPVFAPSIGGMESVAGLLAQTLSHQGVEVTVFTGTPAREYEAPAAFRIVRRPRPHELAACLRRADLIQLSGFSLIGFAAARLARRPIVWLHHDYGPRACARPGVVEEFGPCGWLHLGRGCPLRGAVTSATRAQRARQYVWEWAQSLAVNQVAVNVVTLPGHLGALQLPRAVPIPHGIPRIDREPVRYTRPRVTFVARHVAGKGGDLLIRAVAQLPPGSVDLALLGDGPLRGVWQRLAAEMGVEATWPGACSEADKIERLLGSDIVVVPPHGSEYFGLVAAEAMACGAFVIAADHGGLGELVRWLGGAVFPRRDVHALACRLAHALADREALRRAGERAREAVRHHLDPDAWARRYIDVYEAVIAGGAA